jgi:adenylate cyclase
MERAAVAAGREIFTAVGALPMEDAKDGGAKLSVGVGIATGDAFVGNVRAADRMIWTAIGNTTNLAARLQSLSRSLAAALVIDAATWEALDSAGRRDFERHPAIEIRGRRQVQDIFALPLGTG